MAKKATTNKGQELEEILRAYFLRAGFFVLRSVPFILEDEDITDIDLWLYERPTGTTRRVQIVDIRSRSKPKAVERLFWTSGLARALDVDGAYVATTDKRPSIRGLAKKLDLIIIDGADIQRIKRSDSIRYQHRLTDTQLVLELVNVDKARQNKELQSTRVDILRSISEGFGRASLARSLTSFTQLARAAVGSHPNSGAAIAYVRLSYLAAAIASQSIDYISVEAPFRSAEERRDLVLNAVRYGALDKDEGQNQLRVAVELVRSYAPESTVNKVEAGLKADLEAIPAEIIADQIVRMLKDGKLFTAGRELEDSAYNRRCPSFDELDAQTKSLLGAFLDFSNVRRDAFAAAISSSAKSATSAHASTDRTENQSTEQVPLFKEK